MSWDFIVELFELLLLGPRGEGRLPIPAPVPVGEGNPNPPLAREDGEGIPPPGGFRAKGLMSKGSRGRPDLVGFPVVAVVA